VSVYQNLFIGFLHGDVFYVYVHIIEWARDKNGSIDTVGID
jgi:hypothetical protein